MRRMPCDPLRDLRAWQQRLERLAADQHGSAWAPPIDVYETDDRYVVCAELPGLTREQIDVSLQDNRLTIAGSRPAKVSQGSGGLRYHQVERGHGMFQRTFEFGEAIDQTAIGADLHDGLLTITLPKRPIPKPRRIEVG
jgi:HSP20 family protein